MKKSRKRNALVLALIVLLLATAVGYALFASNLTITGTAAADGLWDVHFENAAVSPTKAGNTAVISNSATGTDDVLTVNVTLSYPTDSSTVTVDVVNAGTADAILTGITITPTAGSGSTLSGDSPVAVIDNILQMNLNTEGWAANSKTIAAGESDSFGITFTWIDEGTKDVDINGTFEITMNFSQPTP